MRRPRGTRRRRPALRWSHRALPVTLGTIVGLAMVGRSVLAQEGEPAADAAAGPAPTVYHVPPGTLEAGVDLEIFARVTDAWRLVRLELIHRREDRGVWERVPFRRISTGDLRAAIPGSEIAAPAIEYRIVSVDRDGREREHFGSEDRPHRVEVVGMTDEQLQELEERRYGGRHRFAVRSDWSAFGERSVRGWVPDPEEYPAAEVLARTDDYVETRFDYTYRILGVVHAIHFGVGSLRGQAPRLEYLAERGDILLDQRRPGFDYGWTGITFEFHRYFAVALDAYLGGSQSGFDGGGGGLLRVGNTAGTHFDIGGDYVSNMGYRAWFRLAWDTVPYVPMSLTAEFTDWPVPDDDRGDGVRLWYAAAARVWRGLIVDVRVGYAARHGSNTGGPIVGGGIAYEF